MPWAAKFDPHHLQSFVIVRSLRPEVETLFRLEIHQNHCVLSWVVDVLRCPLFGV
jgi:hypothetical protein